MSEWRVDEWGSLCCPVRQDHTNLHTSKFENSRHSQRRATPPEERKRDMHGLAPLSVPVQG